VKIQLIQGKIHRNHRQKSSKYEPFWHELTRRKDLSMNDNSQDDPRNPTTRPKEPQQNPIDKEQDPAIPPPGPSRPKQDPKDIIEEQTIPKK
jgi:hypothetical protein